MSEGAAVSLRRRDRELELVVLAVERHHYPQRLFFAINPTLGDVTLPLPTEVTSGAWRQLADHERFFSVETPGATQPVESELFVPALGCALWVSES